MPQPDDPSFPRARDPGGMLRLTLDLPRQVREGWAIGCAAPLPPLSAPPAALVLAGMGGSAIGGELVCALLGRHLEVPIIVVRDSRLPGFVGPRSVVIATSYSGETEETVALARAASDAGATLAAITTGGLLAEVVAHTGSAIHVPGGRAPRAALGYLVIPVLALLERWGLGGPWAEKVKEAATVLDEIATEVEPDVPTVRNPAKRLAEQLLGRIPAVYGATAEVEVAARRWKCQFNENSKTLATWSAFPELAHNETVGWEAPPDIANKFAVVMLLAGDESETVLRQVRLACDLVFRPAAGIHTVRGRGAGRLARLVSLILVGDVTSVYLAYLRGVDPTPVKAIEALKARMRGG